MESGEMTVMTLANDSSAAWSEPQPASVTLPDGRLLTATAATISVRFEKRGDRWEPTLFQGVRVRSLHLAGESLFQFFRQIGIQVRMNTTIRYKDHGELKSISQRLKEK